MTRTNLMIACYFGHRRARDDRYRLNLLTYIKLQVSLLQKYKHNLDQITFIVNTTPDLGQNIKDYLYNELPKTIQKATVELMERENIGMSYGAWSDCYSKYREAFEYYIFCEDDYYFVEDNFDQTLIDMFNSYKNCGYLCGIARPDNNIYAPLPHAGNSVGISNYKIIEDVYLKNNNSLPHANSTDYGDNEQNGQVAQTYAFVKAGYSLYDLRERYRVPFHRSIPGDIQINFPENKNVLIAPAQYIYENQTDLL